MLYERAAVIGIGLIGGSFALAARRAGLVGRTVGCARSAATREGALVIGAADEVTADPAEAVREADLVYLAVPVGSMAPAFAAIAPHLQPGALVTDAGSTKRTIMAAAAEHLPGHAFLGGHPIAGSEQAGIQAAHGGLFAGRTYVLTPSASVSDAALARFRELVEAIGARAVILDAETHDRCLAATSHLPHLVASALATAVAGCLGSPGGTGCASDPRVLVGTGFADTTRIAAGSPELWRAIFAANADNLRAALGVVRDRLTDFDAALQAEDWDAVAELLETGRRARGELMGHE
jgi:prephenate dehydrogenase